MLGQGSERTAGVVRLCLGDGFLEALVVRGAWIAIAGGPVPSGPQSSRARRRAAPVFGLALAQRLLQELRELVLLGFLEAAAQSSAEADAVRAAWVCVQLGRVFGVGAAAPPGRCGGCARYRS